MSIILQFVAGLVFGVGLIVAGMADPAKVLGFLDLGAIPLGSWDPSLLFVMVGGIAVTFLGYKIAFRRSAPLLATRFVLPAATAPDARLVTGAALFGVGWGLAGFCPGPALVSTLTAGVPGLIFIVAMLAGMAGARRLAAATASMPVEPVQRL